MITIGIVEDNKRIAEDLQDILSMFDTVSVLFVAGNGIELLRLLESERPMLLIMDIQMPEMDGIAAVKAVKAKYPDIKIMMHTVLNNDEAVLESILLGANGYLLKNEKPQKLIDAVHDVMEGGAPITPGIAQKLLKYLSASPLLNRPEEKQENPLSEREMEILALISEGLSYKLIADKLFLSTKTVGKHIEHIYTKLQVNNKVDAVNAYRRFRDQK
ncbi:MAG: response regulator transcription factor [Sediminibacterium sp.]|nr:response regulator transcription factor [Sediminibacterium sp.]